MTARRWSWVAVLVVCTTAIVSGQAGAPPSPVPPEVLSRDEAGRATVRAVRLTEPLDLDGSLDESVYQEVPAVTGLIQVEPVEGVPASERTEAWILFDDDNVYISARCWDSAPESQWVVNELRRDSMNTFQNENLTILLDTFYDRRNAVYLLVTPIGGRLDGQVTDERDFNGDWNPIWDVETGRFDGGWTVEMAIPFKSLRYRPGRTQVWGVQFRRMIRWKNEVAYLTPIPAAPAASFSSRWPRRWWVSKRRSRVERSRSNRLRSPTWQVTGVRPRRSRTTSVATSGSM